MKEIFTKDGTPVLVSDSWYERLNNRKWHKVGRKNEMYICDSHKKLMHRIIVNAKANQIVDHIDGNHANNQIENLRIATSSQNIANSKISKNNKSGYKGVYLGNGGWRASIMKYGKTIHLGTYKEVEDAAKAYDKKAIELFGEFAKLNFE